MPETLRGVDADRLERSCSARGDFIHFGTGGRGLERAEVQLTESAFEPHQHDTYAIGVTVAGVQTFRYRGRRCFCLPGQFHFLHPDETHDGGPATPEGFRYRIVYLDPALISRALGGTPLPFVADPVQEPTPETLRLASVLNGIDDALGELACAEAAATVSDVLSTLSGRRQRGGPVDLAAVEAVREYLCNHADEQTPASRLEAIAGIDRFTIARHFRRAFGTSPDRYRTQRRLELARAAIERGTPLARAAADTGFADQSHMTRQFKRTYGMTPARWARVVTPA